MTTYLNVQDVAVLLNRTEAEVAALARKGEIRATVTSTWDFRFNVVVVEAFAAKEATT